MKCSITIADDRLKVVSPYSPVLVDRFKSIPGRRYNVDDKTWSFPAVKDICLMLLDACGLVPWMMPSDVRRLVEDSDVVPASKPVDMSLIDGHSFLTKPYDHQKVNLARLIEEPRWLICDEMGTGKTHAVCNRLVPFIGQQCNILIVCPKSVMQGWKTELLTHAQIQSEIVTGTTAQRKASLASRRMTPNVKVTNYASLIYTGDEFDNIDWDVVIIDEAHVVKNFTARTSRAVRRLTSKARYVYGLSGTPAPNGLEDWLGVLSAVKPDLLPVTTKTGFEARYCVKNEIQAGVWRVSGYRNVQELHGYIASITSRVTKDECLDLPPKVISNRFVTLEGEQARIYRELRRDAIARLDKMRDDKTLTVRNVITEGLRLLQIVGGHMTDDAGIVHDIASPAKMAALSDVLDEVGDRQVVVWSCFRPEVERLAKYLKERGDVSTLVGGMSNEERAENLDRFRRGDTRFFVGTAAAGGTGINQLTVADTEIYYSRNYSLTEYLQSIDRLHRIGQTRSVSVVKLMASNTVDEKIDAALDRKQDMLQMMLGEPEQML